MASILSYGLASYYQCFMINIYVYICHGWYMAVSTCISQVLQRITLRAASQVDESSLKVRRISLPPVQIANRFVVRVV